MAKKLAKSDAEIYVENNSGLEIVFSREHEYHNVLFYDRYEGKHYDRSKDLFVDYEDLKIYGL